MADARVQNEIVAPYVATKSLAPSRGHDCEYIASFHMVAMATAPGNGCFASISRIHTVYYLCWMAPSGVVWPHYRIATTDTATVSPNMRQCSCSCSCNQKPLHRALINHFTYDFCVHWLNNFIKRAGWTGSNFHLSIALHMTTTCVAYVLNFQ